MSEPLSEEQEQFLAECEAQFSGRYSQADKDFMQVKIAGVSQPPVVQPWYAKQRGGGGGGGDRDRRRSRSRSRSGGRRDRERSRSGGRREKSNERGRRERSDSREEYSKRRRHSSDRSDESRD
eukprot:GFUD01019806.1.p1 GENE.GFUD01019806.1~~GFUD01019806.1.p1  ORF type:complete len:123 (+),score=49.42 GFUD01019806.1:78-446(+)